MKEGQSPSYPAVMTVLCSYLNSFAPGTTIGFIEFGRNPELGRKIKGFHALAPVATLGHIKGAIKILSNFASEVEVNHLIFLFSIQVFQVRHRWRLLQRNFLHLVKIFQNLSYLRERSK